MSRMTSGLVVALVALCTCGQAMASSYFVSPTGSDSYSGDATHPFLTIQHAADLVNPGDNVTVQAGNYTGFVVDHRSGNADNYITFKADAGVNITTPGRTWHAGVNLEGSNYVIVDGFTVTGMNYVGSWGLRSVENDHTVFRNNVSRNNYEGGLLTGHSDYVTIENNVLSGSIKQHGIYVSNACVYPTVRGNVSFNNAGCGVHINSDNTKYDNYISNALVEDNVFYGNGATGGSGINLGSVRDSLIRNNLVYEEKASGISIYQGNGDVPSIRDTVVNNTIIVAAAGRWALNVQNASTNNTVLNNILYNYSSWKGATTISPDSLTGFVSDYNAVISRFTLDDGGTIINLAAWRTQTGQDVHSFIATPAQLFVSPGTYDYRLLSNSPAVNAGTTIAGLLWDLQGHPRPAAGGYDVGAYEYVIDGDINADGHVDISDLTILSNHYGQTAPAGTTWTWRDGDFNRDGVLDVSDLTLMSSHYGTADAVVPEPLTLALLTLGGMAVIRRRTPRRRHFTSPGTPARGA